MPLETNSQPLQDELDIISFLRVLWKHRIFIVVVVVISALGAAIATSFMPKKYRAEALLAPVSEEGRGGRLSAALGGLGGLASMAGVSVGGGGSIQQNIATIKSRDFLWLFIKKNNLLIDLVGDKGGNIWGGYRKFISILDVQYNPKSSLLRISIEWTEPEVAALWVNSLVKEINNYARVREIERSQKNLEYLNGELARTRVVDFRRSLYELIAQEQKKAMLANTQNEFVFRVLDKAEAPDIKASPKRSKIVVVSMLTGLLFALFLVFLREVISREKKAKKFQENICDLGDSR